MDFLNVKSEGEYPFLYKGDVRGGVIFFLFIKANDFQTPYGNYRQVYSEGECSERKG